MTFDEGKLLSRNINPIYRDIRDIKIPLGVTDRIRTCDLTRNNLAYIQVKCGRDRIRTCDLFNVNEAL